MNPEEFSRELEKVMINKVINE